MGVESGISEDIGDKSSCEPTRALVSFKHDIHFGAYSDVVPVFPVHDSLLPLVLFCLFSGEHRPFRFQSFFCFVGVGLFHLAHAGASFCHYDRLYQLFPRSVTFYLSFHYADDAENGGGKPDSLRSGAIVVSAQYHEGRSEQYCDDKDARFYF